MKLAFTTLACPNWTWEKILDEAQRLGYDGIEIRGIENEMFAPRTRPFLQENIEKTKEELKTRNLEICCLDTSCMLHDELKHVETIEEGKAYIDLASKLNAPFIRVFGNNIPDPSKRTETIDFVARALNELGLYAENKNVIVLIETHGDFSASADLAPVMEKVTSKAVGVLWDVNHPFKAFEEPLTVTFERLAKYIKHTHYKDSKGPGARAPLCLVGEGDLPVAESIAILHESGYEGYVSFEWEKKWHPTIEEPEVAIPAFINYIKPIIEEK